MSLDNSPYLLIRSPSASPQTKSHSGSSPARYPNKNNIFPLKEGNCWTLGRNKDNTIVIDSRWISRTHAMLQSTNNQDFYLIDLGSRNGTFVNGHRVSSPVKLHNKDVLSFGQTDLEFYNPSEENHPKENESTHTSRSL